MHRFDSVPKHSTENLTLHLPFCIRLILIYYLALVIIFILLLVISDVDVMLYVAACACLVGMWQTALALVRNTFE